MIGNNEARGMDPRGGATREHLEQARHGLSEAAGAMRDSMSHAGAAIREGMSQAGPAIRQPLHNAAEAARHMAQDAKVAATHQYDELMHRGHDLLQNAQTMIQRHPLAFFGIAVAAGYLLAQSMRRPTTD